MIAMLTIGVFFLLLILVYPAVCALITLYGTLKKRKARKIFQGIEAISEIDAATDRLKKYAFFVSLVITFFVVAPFIALVVIADLP